MSRFFSLDFCTSHFYHYYYYSASYIRDQRLNFLSGHPPPYERFSSHSWSFLIHFFTTGISQAAKGSLNSSDGVPSWMSALLKVVGCSGLTSSQPVKAVSRRCLLRESIGRSRLSRRSIRAFKNNLCSFLECMLDLSGTNERW